MDDEGKEAAQRSFGVVSHWNAEKKYGFIALDEQDHVHHVFANKDRIYASGSISAYDGTQWQQVEKLTSGMVVQVAGESGNMLVEWHDGRQLWVAPQDLPKLVRGPSTLICDDLICTATAISGYDGFQWQEIEAGTCGVIIQVAFDTGCVLVEWPDHKQMWLEPRDFPKVVKEASHGARSKCLVEWPDGRQMWIANQDMSKLPPPNKVVDRVKRGNNCIFVHSSGLFGTKDLKVGDRVQFEIEHDAKRSQDRAVRCARCSGNEHAASSDVPVASGKLQPTDNSVCEVPTDSCVPLLVIEDDDLAESDDNDDDHALDDVAEACEEEQQAEAEAAKAASVCIDMCPTEVRFTHDRISSHFRAGLLLDEAIDSIAKSTLSFEEFPAIICVEKEGNMYSLNNRRLFVARVLHSLNVLQSMCVRVVPFSDPAVQHKRDGVSKWERAFSTANGGASVHVRSKYKDLQTAADAATTVKKQKERADRQVRRTKLHEVMTEMRPVILSMLPPPKGLLQGLSKQEGIKKQKWHLQEKLPRDMLDTIGRQYCIDWEIYVSPNGAVGIKALPIPRADGLTPERYQIGCIALREAVRRMYQFHSAGGSGKLTSQRLPKNASELHAATKASPQDARAAEKQKSLFKKRGRGRGQR